MESANLSQNVSITSEKVHLGYCSQFRNINFEVVLTPAPLIVIAVWNILLAITATLSNIVVFIAVRRSSSLHFPSKLLLLSLILTDAGTGAVTQPVFAAFLLAKAANLPNVTCSLLWTCYYAFSLFSSASLMMIVAISVDRFTAHFLHLKYKKIVTARNVGVFLSASWSFSLVYASMLSWNKSLHVYATLCGMSAFLFVTTVTYIKIYRGLRRHHGFKVHVKPQPQHQAAGAALNIAKYRRSASSMMWLYALFLLCYLPHLCFFVVMMSIPPNFLTMCISDFLITLVFLNSSLNPFVYCYRLPDIRSDVLRTVKMVFRFKQTTSPNSMQVNETPVRF